MHPGLDSYEEGKNNLDFILATLATVLYTVD